MRPIAYDPATQAWLHGNPTKAVLYKLLSLELSVLTGPTGREYFRAIRHKLDLTSFDRYVDQVRLDLERVS